MKVLMIQTRNQTTARRSQLPLPRVLGQTPRPQTTEREYHGQLIRDIFEQGGFPLAAFGSYIKGHLTFVCVPSRISTRTSDHDNATAYYCSGTSWAIIWIYFPNLRHTAAILLHREGDGDDRKLEVINDLLRLQEHRGHPMLLGYVKTKISVGFTFDMLDDMNSETLELEQEIGFPTWDWILDREVQGKDNINDDHDQAVSRFNVLSGKLTNIRFRLRTFEQQIKFISRCNAKYAATLFDSDVRGKQECSQLQDMMDVIWDYTHVHLFDADTLAQRLANQMQSIFQLTNQRDSRANLAIADFNNELAWQAHGANSSMRTIAFVSLLFLPGTFVASFFDTPMFNWVPSEGKVLVAEPFWIYWTVSGLLTLILCAGWAQYLQSKRKWDRRHRWAASERFKDRIRRRRTNTSSENGSAGDVPNGNAVLPMSNGAMDPTILKAHGGKGLKEEMADVEIGFGVLNSIDHISIDD
ncbi:hypothetical protein UCRPC4_g06715 [Phaeomoniella chlamydospora]|uniref:Uncharacterized protein n=1 Tax=Phaeomoniella chlamydospora TaxID=158046 RepID=A0A0G2DWQ4_PHACM|nr:hypothetical protein UCRPC4_g06715 [Phaeomoniella chlamydospora]